MKKLLSFLCAVALLTATGCSFAISSSSSSGYSGFLGNPNSSSSSSSSSSSAPHTHVDANADDKCDTCKAALPHVHKDANNDETCDTCQAPLHEHVEVNGYCSKCGALLHTHVAVNGYCGICNATMHEHADGDNNGKCDVCSVSVQTSIDFYSVNDLHGKFDVAQMTTYLRNAQTVNESTVILSAGDMWQGSMESNATKGNIITEWMNDVGFAAMTLGNHEFDWGENAIRANAELADFPLLAINIFDKTTGERADYCDASVILESNGVKIGVIGAIGKGCYQDIAIENVQGLEFKEQAALTSLVKAESMRLREQGADMIVYLLHDGSSSKAQYDTSLSNGYVDIVFEGHTHSSYQNQDSYGVWHLQAGGDNNTGLSHAKLTVNLLNRTVVAETAKVVNKSTYTSLTADPIVNQLLQKYDTVLAPLKQPLGTNASYRDYDGLSNYAAKSYFALGMARWGNNPAYQGKIVLGGGYIGVRSPYKLYTGQVTYADLYPLFPFDNALVLCKLSGERLKAQFINSTNSKYYMYYGEDGTAIKNNIVDSETYYVVVDTYCANFNFYPYGYLEIVEYYDAGRTYFGRDAIADYTRGGGLSANPPSPETFTVSNGNGSGEVDTTIYTKVETIHASSTAMSTIHVKGTVIAVGKTGFMLHDGTGAIFYYTGSMPTVSVDDTVVISGDTTEYGTNWQFSSSTATYQVKDVDVPAYNTPTLQSWNSASVDAYTGEVGEYVQVTAKIYTSGNYVNAEKITSSSTKQLSLIPPTNSVLQGITLSTTAQELVITGYTCYIVNSRYVYVIPTSLTPVGGSTPSTAQTLTINGTFGGNGVTEYASGNYGTATKNGHTLAYYRAYRPSGETEYCLQLLPYASSAQDGSLGGSISNTTPIYGITSISITYKSNNTAHLYTGDDRVATMTAYTLPATNGYEMKTFAIPIDNFFKLETNINTLYVQSISISYNNTYTAYNETQKQSGSGDYRLNPVTFTGTLVAGQSSVSVPIAVAYDGGSCQILQTKTYTYYTLDYVESHPQLSLQATAMLTPRDVAIYYTAFKQFPANYAVKNFSSGNEWADVEAVFDNSTRYVSKYSRTDGYATAVPYRSSSVYYEFDIDLGSYSKNSRGVGRVVAWELGWTPSGYNSAPVCVYTDDHYATFQEYLNNGSFGTRFDAEMPITNTVYSAPATLS